MRFAKDAGSVFSWFVLIMLLGCASPAPMAQTTLEPTVPATQLAPITCCQPLQIFWELAKSPMGTNGESSLGVHFVVLQDQRVTVIYSFAGDEQLQEEFGSKIRLADNTGKKYEPVQKALLANLEHVHVGSLTFKGLARQANQLTLEFEPSTNNPLVVEVAHLDSSSAQSSESSQSALGRQGPFEQSGYRITFNGFYLYKGDLAAEQQDSTPITQAEDLATAAAAQPKDPLEPLPTAEPIQPSAITLELAQGEPMASEATLRVETIATKQVQFLYLVILKNGEVRAKVLE